MTTTTQHNSHDVGKTGWGLQQALYTTAGTQHQGSKTPTPHQGSKTPTLHQRSKTPNTTPGKQDSQHNAREARLPTPRHGSKTPNTTPGKLYYTPRSCSTCRRGRCRDTRQPLVGIADTLLSGASYNKMVTSIRVYCS